MSLTDTQKDTLSLWYAVNMSLTSFYKLVNAFDAPSNALLVGKKNPSNWQQLNIHKSHLARLSDTASMNAFLYRINEHYDKGLFGLLFSDDDDYPENLAQLYDPPPVLFYKGNKGRLQDSQLAIVGTRQPSEYAKKITFDLAQYLVQAGFTIASGLALGVDSVAHKGALAQQDHELLGRTVGVMGTGIDVCYPPQNQGLFFEIVEAGGCLISELLPATPASKHTFPRRNRIVTGLSLATIVTEAAIQSGSLISARLAAEQGKQVFVVPNRIDSPQSEGCHHLIREGATLIYHPNQIIEELRSQGSILPTSFSQISTIYQENLEKNKKDASHAINEQETPPTQEIPSHLNKLYQLLSTDPKDLDSLVLESNKNAGELLAQLTELEIYGWVIQTGGLYARA